MLRGIPGWRRMRPARSRVRVDRGWGDAEVTLHLVFRGRSPMHAGVGVDEGQILALPGGEAGRVAARHLIHRLIRLGLQPEGADERTLSCHVDPIRAP